nr:MAG TPA: hypothetical protein [Caudoviricetes sp.]
MLFILRIKLKSILIFTSFKRTVCNICYFWRQ